MEVEVELFGQLAERRKRCITLTLEHPLSVMEVAALLDVKLTIVGLVTINGLQSELQDEVPPRSRLCFFPYLSGG